MVKKRPTQEELEEPVSADPLTFEQIVESLVVTVDPVEDDDNETST